MNAREVTEQILSAWDDEDGDEQDAVVEQPGEDEEVVEQEQPEQGDEDEQETEEETQEEEAEEEDGEDQPAEDEPAEDEQEAPPGFDTDDPEIQAYLAKYQGDPVKALKGAVELQRVLGRQGQEKAVLARRNQELEQELRRSAALTPQIALNEEQRSWVEAAVESGNPLPYIQQAMGVDEFDLARAVCEQWAEERPYDAARVANQIDIAEQQRTHALLEAQEAEQTVNHEALLEVLAQYYPQLPVYSEQIVTTMGALGEQHPLVIDARSNDPEAAMRGVIGLYEIARASTSTVKTARDKLRRDQRQAADDARGAAVVSSAQATPATGETPRPRRLGPGLTLEAIDDAWET